MERVGCIAMHLVPTPATTATILTVPCAGWKILPGPHASISNVYIMEVNDQKAFLSSIEFVMKKMKAGGEPLPKSAFVFKMDSGLFISSFNYANDMDRIANMARARKIRGEITMDHKLLEMSSQKFEWHVSFVDERPIKMTGSRVVLVHMAIKSPEHVERLLQMNPTADLNTAFGAEYRKTGIKCTTMFRCSDTSAQFVSVLSDEAAYKKGGKEMMAKFSDAMGGNLMDSLVAPPEREFGTVVYFKNIDEI